ncbi:MAG: YciI family protein [Steroidobacteraceae bacterium]
MQYMMMCCIEEKHWAALPDERREAIMREYGEWIAEVEKRGQHRMSARLAPSATAHTIRHDGGRRVVIDGPFAETKEQFGGYHLVECRNLDEAVALAERIPTLPHGGVVEVRAVEPAS